MGTLQFSKREIIHTEHVRNMNPPETYHVVKFRVPFTGVWDAERVKHSATNKCEEWWPEDFKRMTISDVHSPITFDGNESRQRDGHFIMTVVLLAEDKDMRTQYGNSQLYSNI